MILENMPITVHMTVRTSNPTLVQSAKHPLTNDQAKAANCTIRWGLKKRLDGAKGNLVESCIQHFRDTMKLRKTHREKSELWWLFSALISLLQCFDIR